MLTASPVSRLRVYIHGLRGCAFTPVLTYFACPFGWCRAPLAELFQLGVSVWSFLTEVYDMPEGQSGLCGWVKVLFRLSGAGGGGGQSLPLGSDPALAQQTHGQHVGDMRWASVGRCPALLCAMGEDQPLAGSVLRRVLFIHLTTSSPKALIAEEAGWTA